MHDVRVEKPLLEKVDKAGKSNREYFRQHGVYVINLMSAPGSGKTTLIERTLEYLQGRLKIGIIEGDVQGRLDADRLERFGVPIIQINTHEACHLNPIDIRQAAGQMDLDDLDVLLIENVGNLVCPAQFDLGETDRVMILSVTEGHDKPLKYPLMFRSSSLLLLNKIDLLEHTDFDIDKASEYASGLNPRIKIIRVSAKNGTGIPDWVEWIESGIINSKSK